MLYDIRMGENNNNYISRGARTAGGLLASVYCAGVGIVSAKMGIDLISKGDDWGVVMGVYSFLLVGVCLTGLYAGCREIAEGLAQKVGQPLFQPTTLSTTR